MKPYVAPLGRPRCSTCSRRRCGSCRTALQKPDNAGAGSTDYMHLFGLVALGYMWAQMAKAAQEKLAAGATARTDRMKAKLVTGKFFMERMLPETGAHLAARSRPAPTRPDGAAAPRLLSTMGTSEQVH